MIWLTWRQFRVQALVLAGAVVALLLFLASTHGGLPTFGDTFLEAFRSQRLATTVYSVGITVGLCAPAIVGVFWGDLSVCRATQMPAVYLIPMLEPESSADAHNHPRLSVSK